MKEQRKNNIKLFGRVHEQFFTNGAQWMFPSDGKPQKKIPVILSTLEEEEFPCQLTIKAIDTLSIPTKVTFENEQGVLLYGGFMSRENGSIQFFISFEEAQLVVLRASKAPFAKSA